LNELVDLVKMRLDFSIIIEVENVKP